MTSVLLAAKALEEINSATNRKHFANDGSIVVTPFLFMDVMPCLGSFPNLTPSPLPRGEGYR
jgi:hypothetical protein